VEADLCEVEGGAHFAWWKTVVISEVLSPGRGRVWFGRVKSAGQFGL
jgi:hypothetical protein